MADDYPKPPESTAVPGTGQAVQTATDPEGNKWQYDSEKGNWVNLSTGDAVSPKTFSQIAGRSGNAARDTIAIARAMRNEEAAMTPQLRPPATQTATLPPAPITAPQATQLLPPYSPPELARVQAQQPVPSTRVPPSDAAQTFYKMRQVDWLTRNRGMKPADAMKMVGIGQPPMKQTFHSVGGVGYAFDPVTGQATAKTGPPVEKPQSPLGKLQADRALAKARGDEASVRQYDAAIEEQISNKGRSIYMGMDDQGKPIFQMTEGGGKAIGPPTVAMQTQAQERLAQYKNAVQTMDMANVTPQMVGVKGVTGEWVIDRGLAQLTGQAEGTRVQGRTLLRLLREGVLRQVSDTSRYSAQDRKEIEEIFPSSGWFESADRANKALSQIKRVFQNRAKVYAHSINQKAPVWSLTDSELKQEYPDKQEIADLMRRNSISREEALDALVRGGYQ